MTIPRSLRRLHELRVAEEQQRNSVLASAIQELQQLERALKLAHDRAMLGRKIVNASLESGEPDGRIAGLQEIATADRVARVLAARIQAAEDHIAKIREEFLAARVQRRQAETLLESAFARDAIEGNRRTQMALDDWHRSRRNSSSSNHPSKMRESGEPAETTEHERT